MLTYLEIHLYFTLPPCLLLFLTHRPLLHKRDTFRFLLLCTIVVAATIPWDSYLIRSGVWGYPEGVVLATLFSIPVEEIAFFVIQTYLTTQLYALLHKPIFHPSHLPLSPQRGWVGAALLLLLSLLGGTAVHHGHRLTYLGLILLWASPVLALLWYLSGPYALRLPLLPALGPVLIPTAYLWAVDTYALREGIWAIGEGTKLGWEVWRGLEVEEALFFLISNVLLTMGCIAFSHAFALADVLSLSRPADVWSVPPNPLAQPLHTIRVLYRALTLPPDGYPTRTISHLRTAARTLQKHSKSFHLASSVFGERCRLLLLSYYAFCRVTDDLVDEAGCTGEAAGNVRLIERFLALFYPGSAGLEQGELQNDTQEDKNTGRMNGHGHIYTNGPAHSEEDDLMLASHDSGYGDCWPSPTHTSRPKTTQTRETVDTFIGSLPASVQPAFSLFRLLAPLLPPEPVYDLLRGYAFDALAFSPSGQGREVVSSFPDVLAEKEKMPLLQKLEKPLPAIQTEADLILYCRRVAGSVGVACTHLMFAASGLPQPVPQELQQKASDMGVALQLVNVARDLVDDAKLERSYVPSSWAATPSDTTPSGILANPQRAVDTFRPRLLKLAFAYYQRSAPALEQLPEESRLGARGAVACYMAMGVLMRSWSFKRKGRLAMGVKLVVVLLVLYAPRWGRGFRL
ncbi:hypothetical protein CALVIDRAFT_561996 [Calocera viscosa TUFC12733]|uniref:Bifunctional lycopene cyclase/phytoene synthase n=1 Tax=Calocera viscosa (strain TUFC12733) TaxID=1330018 RepID=A0A167P930_CALVF|nr:hypothetical protein CALVIDRAFT_561996 [Calocera viscosa TUFC12733]